MASHSPFSPFGLAPEKLAQMINPLFWLPSGTGQIGFINISGAASSKPEVEADIIENVATYGRQLGRISDLLEAMLRHVDHKQWKGGDAQALRGFEDMMAKIAAVKAGHLAPTKGNVDKLVAGIKSLEANDPDEYRRIKEQLRKELFDGDDRSKAPRRRR